MTTARELMHKPLSISENSSISQVISKLLELNKSRLVVTDNQKPVGIVTEKDIAFFLFTEKSGQSLDKIPLSHIMKPIVYTNSMSSPESCANMMIEKNISSLAVASQNNLEGIFTKTDLARFYFQNHTKKHTVSDYMTDHVFTVHDTTSLTRVMSKMLEHKISRIIAKDQNDNPVGVISFRDFFRVSLELGVQDMSDDFSLSAHTHKGFVSSDGFGALTLASEIMTRGIFSVKKTHDLAQACRIMINHNISALGVTDEHHKLSGIISKTDVTRALASLA